MKYFQLAPDSELPNITDLKPFRSIVIIEATVTPTWQKAVSDWLVRSGCLYMMAWGRDCSSWDDSVDLANLEEWDYNDIPDEKFVMTTWHDKEELKNVFELSKLVAEHPSIIIKNTVIVHVSNSSKEQDIRDEYNRA